jgi:hypothetical protein
MPDGFYWTYPDWVIEEAKRLIEEFKRREAEKELEGLR